MNSSPPRRATTSLPRSSAWWAPRHADQHLVAGLVAEPVVDGLEAVEVEQVDGCEALRRAARQRLLERLSRGRAGSAAR